jgi:hypothetical protein
LQAVSEIVHDIDLKDTKFGREEVTGIASLIAGLPTRTTNSGSLKAFPSSTTSTNISERNVGDRSRNSDRFGMGQGCKPSDRRALRHRQRLAVLLSTQGTAFSTSIVGHGG